MPTSHALIATKSESRTDMDATGLARAARSPFVVTLSSAILSTTSNVSLVSCGVGEASGSGDVSGFGRIGGSGRHRRRVVSGRDDRSSWLRSTTIVRSRIGADAGAAARGSSRVISGAHLIVGGRIGAEDALVDGAGGELAGVIGIGSATSVSVGTSFDFRGELRGGLARGWGFGAHRDLDRVAAKDLAEKRETIAHGRLGPVETARVWPLPLAAHPRGKTARSVLGYERVPILPALAARSRREGTPIESHATRVARGSKVTNLRPPHFVTPRALEGEWR